MSDKTISNPTSFLDSVISTLTTKVMADKTRNISKPDLSDDTIHEIITQAKYKERISVEDMCCVLAVDEEFNGTLERLLYEKYDFKILESFDADGSFIKAELSSPDGRFRLWKDMFDFWCYGKKFWGWEQTLKRSELNTRRHDKDSHGLEGEGKGDLLKFEDIKVHFDGLKMQLPSRLFPGSQNATIQKVTQTPLENTSLSVKTATIDNTDPYRGFRHKDVVECLEAWKEPFIDLDLLIRGMTLNSYSEDKIKDIYQKCGYTDWESLIKTQGWMHTAWHSIIQRLAFNIFLHGGGIKSKQGDYEPLRVYKKTVLGFFYLWDSNQENDVPETAYVKLDENLSEYFLMQFGIHLPPFPRVSFAGRGWPDYPCLSTNESDLRFWDKRHEFFPGEERSTKDFHKDGPEKLLKNAFRRHEAGAMPLDELAYVLSKNPEYHPILKGLWEFCGFNDDIVQAQFKKWNDVILSDENHCARSWYWVLACLSIPGHNSFYFEPLQESYPVDVFKITLNKKSQDGEFTVVADPGEHGPDQLVLIGEFQNCIKKIRLKHPFLFEGLEYHPISPRPILDPTKPKLSWPSGEPVSGTDSDYEFLQRSIDIVHPDENPAEYDATKENYDPESHSEWMEVAFNRHVHGAIPFCELSFILSMRDEYSLLLDGLWKVCGFDSGLSLRLPRWHQGMFNDKVYRVRAWYWILARLTTSENRSYYFDSVKTYPVASFKIPVYRENHENGSLEKIDDLGKISPYNFIRFDEFHKKITDLYQINRSKFPDIAMPGPLFSSDQTSEPITGPEPESLHIELPSTNVNNTDTLFGKKERKKTPDQLAKIKCREIAREAWESDPLMTIADFAVSDDVSRACIAIAGKDYIEDTIRDWVKDLCPNRKGGRRPKK